MDHTDFKEARYLEKDWFSTFTLGHDDPGTRNWLDEGEKKSLEDAMASVKTLKDGSSTDDLKTAIDALNTAWNGVASKMYEAAKEETQTQDPGSGEEAKKSKSKKKDDAEIEDADFEVVD